jgi:hypothetical protein
LPSATATVEFTSIPQTYTDLLVKISARDNSSSIGNNMFFKVNSGTSNQSMVQILGETGVSSFSDTQQYYVSNANTSTASTFSNVEVYIPNYASTSTSKSLSIDAVSENNATSAYRTLAAALYASNTAITSILFSTNGAVDFLTNSTFYLYGIKNT